MLQIFSYIFGLVGLKALKKALLIPLGVFLAGMILGFYYYLITTLLFIYNLVQDFLDFKPATDSFTELFFTFLKTVGVLDGFEAGLPFIFSALVFALMTILYQHTVDLIKTLFFVAKTFLD